MFGVFFISFKKCITFVCFVLFKWSTTVIKSTCCTLAQFVKKKKPTELDFYFFFWEIVASVNQSVTVVTWELRLKVTHLDHRHTKMKTVGVWDSLHLNVCVHLKTDMHVYNFKYTSMCVCRMEPNGIIMLVFYAVRHISCCVCWWLLSVLHESLNTFCLCCPCHCEFSSASGSLHTSGKHNYMLLYAKKNWKEFPFLCIQTK